MYLLREGGERNFLKSRYSEIDSDEYWRYLLPFCSSTCSEQLGQYILVVTIQNKLVG